MELRRSWFLERSADVMKTVEREWLGWLTLPLPSTSPSGTSHPMAEMRIVLVTP